MRRNRFVTVMNSLVRRIASTPARARIAPFLVFVALTLCQELPAESARYWIYFAKTLVGGWMLWVLRPLIAEMKWAFSWEAFAVGIGVFIVWVGLDAHYPKFTEAGSPWNPTDAFGSGTNLALMFIVIRILGSTLIVPPLEEVFYRSFLYRWITRPDFESAGLGALHWRPFIVTSLVFGIGHREWLAGIVCGVGYQWLVCRKDRIGDAMTAHAITNFLLGVWIATRGEWQFW